MRFKRLLIWSLVSALIPSLLVTSAYGQQGDGVPSAKADASPRSIEDLYKECETLISEEQYDKAIPLLSSIIAARPDYFPAALLRGRAFNELGETQLAYESFDQAVKNGNKYPGNHNVEAIKERGKSLMALGNFERAIGDFEEVIATAPSDPEYLFLRGKAYARFAAAVSSGRNGDGGRFTNPAIASLTRAISLKDDYAEAYAERGNAYRLSHRFEEAIDDFKKAVTVGDETFRWNGSFAGLVGEYVCDDRGGSGKPLAAKLEHYKARRDFLTLARKAVKPETGAPLNDYVKNFDATIDELTPVTTLYALEFASATDTVQLLGSALEDAKKVKIAVDSRTNRLIISATKKTHEQVEAMLHQLDQPVVADEKSVKRSFVVDSEAKVDVDAAIRQMKLNLYGVTSDRRKTTFEVVGPREALDRLEQRVSQLEEENKPKARTIRIVWLTGEAKQNEKENVPADIKEVVGELQKMGIKDMSVKSQLSVRTTGKFTTSCMQDGEFQLSADGEYSNDSLQIQLGITQRDVVEGNVHELPLVKLTTQIEARLGHPVVLGVSPSSSGHSVFVVVVEE